MKVNRFILGEYQNNCYVLRKDANAVECVIIDTGLDVVPLMSFLAENKLEPLAVILTHGHIDHIKGLEQLRPAYPNIEIYIHPADADMLTESEKNLSPMIGMQFETEKHDHFVNDGDVLCIADISLKVLHTPGHTAGGICLYAEKEGRLFTGDTLFADSVGRTDLPGGNTEQLIHAIKTKLLVLPDKTKVCPGHGLSTTIGTEKTYNQYIQ